MDIIKRDNNKSDEYITRQRGYCDHTYIYLTSFAPFAFFLLNQLIKKTIGPHGDMVVVVYTLHDNPLVQIQNHSFSVSLYFNK